MGGPELCGGAGVPASPDGEFAAAPCPVAVPTILLDFGYADPLCDVYRYFDDEELPIATSGAAALSLLVRCPGGVNQSDARALVFAGSFGPRGMLAVQLDASALGLGSTPAAYDAETRQPIEIVPRHAPPREWLNFSVRLDRHSFRMVVVE